MQEKKVSIIIPVYNAEKYLKRSINSILNQTYKNIELILVDDGSKDNSFKICEEFAKSYKNIIAIHQENGGVSSARNAGLNCATGEYIEFVDADDSIAENCVEKLVNGIKDADVALCGFVMQKTSGEKIITAKEDCVFEFRKDVKKSFELVRQGISNSPCNKLYKKDKIKTLFNKKYFIGEDVIFNLNYIKNCEKISVIKDALYYYDFTNESSAIHTKLRSQENFNEYWDEIYSLNNSFFQSGYEKELNTVYLKAVISQIMRVSQIEKGYKYFKKVLKLYKTEKRVKDAMKNSFLNYFREKGFFGLVLSLLFKMNFNLAMYLVIKIYFKKSYGKK